LAQPDCSRTARTPSGLVFIMATWASAIILLIWARWYGTGS
jgi:hypothetical protein